jgi:hypothetical protein
MSFRSAPRGQNPLLRISGRVDFRGQPKRGPVAPIEAVEPQDALITRPGLEVVVRHISPGGAIFPARLVSGETLDQAASAAFEATTSFDLPGNIAGMIEAGVFTAIDSGDPG